MLYSNLKHQFKSLGKFFCLALAFSAPIALSWELAHDDEGIKAFTKETENSDFLTVKIKSTEQTSVAALLALHRDVDNFKSWGYDLKEAQFISGDDHTYTLHFTYSAPWPVQDRDIVFQTTITYPKQGTARLDFHTVDTLPPLEDHQRVSEAKGYWHFETLGEDKVAIEYVTYSDPGGSLPAMLVNMKAVEIPLATYQAMIEEVKKAPYKDAAMK